MFETYPVLPMHVIAIIEPVELTSMAHKELTCTVINYHLLIYNQ